MFKSLALVLIGSVIAYIVLSVISKEKTKVLNPDTMKSFEKLVQTQEARDLIVSPQFINLTMTEEFKNLRKFIAGDYIKAIAKRLVS